MTAPTPPPLSKSLEKCERSSRLSSTGSRSANLPRDTSPSKNSVSSRRSSTSKARTTTGSRRSSGAGQNVRAVVRNKIAERKAGNNNLSASQHKASPSSGNCNQSVASRSSHSPSSTTRRSSTVSRSSGNQSTAGGSSAPSKKGSRPGSVSQFLKSTHRQLKAEIASIQDKIIFLYVNNRMLYYAPA